ncbi:tRNA dihydrouridine synthase DusB [Chromatium okenii]|uniref:tRNA dihydrouridine synthase DusB n=1 Tax=Chromatium okenii TaxID=61644 RepID=UPI00190552FF|nr:tRNA dihydrouridine synthase DusB [Chromatium okenii]MBK1642398.1 tRNA dihydrouridine synthase DusB [Chromatium okenii]
MITPSATQPNLQSPLRPFVIGNHQFANNLVLAPMAGITDRPFRVLCRQFGAGYTVAEMVAANTALWGSRQSLRRLDYSGESGIIAAQIVGANPIELAQAAQLNVDLGAQIIDINMGCPAQKVCRVAAGSALLRDEPLVGRILAAVVAAVQVPVTLKIRTGWSPETRNAPAIAHIAHDSGIAALTVHGRTRACHYNIPAEHDTLAAVREVFTGTLIANGDIATAEDVRRIVDATGADAIMIGRAARGRPWLFRDLAAELTTGVAPPPLPAPAWIAALVCTHLDELYQFYGATMGVQIARKHLAWYCRSFPQATAFRATVNQAQTPAQQTALVQTFFARCADIT